MADAKKNRINMTDDSNEQRRYSKIAKEKHHKSERISICEDKEWKVTLYQSQTLSTIQPIFVLMHIHTYLFITNEYITKWWFKKKKISSRKLILRGEKKESQAMNVLVACPKIMFSHLTQSHMHMVVKNHNNNNMSERQW